MTIATRSFVSTWDRATGAKVSTQIVQKSAGEKLKLGQAGDEPWAARLNRQPDFIIDATTTASETGSVGDLTATKGLSLAAGYVYPVRLRYSAQDGEDRWSFERHYRILGGTTPVITGGEEIQNAIGLIAGAAVKYGNIKAQATYSGDTATAVPLNSTPGSSLGNNATNTVTLTHPIARANPKNFWSQPARAAAAVAGARTVDVIAANATTASAFISDVASPTAAAPSGTLNVYGYIEPPPNGFLTMSTNNVQAHVSMDASDNVLHRLEIFVDDPVPQPFLA